MRRKDREVTDRSKIRDIIMSCDTCRLGLITDNAPYIVPLSFGYDEGRDKKTFYFHSANEGRKIDILKEQNMVGFELDTDCEIVKGANACQFTAMYKSIIGTGRIQFINRYEEKIEALNIIMRHYSSEEKFEYSEEMINRVCVFKLDIEELSCKEHI